METCHLLLGKPWKYDKATIHDETKNTYSFMLGKTRLTLLHSPWAEEPKPSQGNGQSIIAKQELTEKESDIKGVVPGLIKEQLGRFVDMVRAELPKVVPSMQYIQPQLVLVLKSNVPNHPHDIKSPKKLEELEKHLEEVSLSESIAIFHEEEEPLEEVNISNSFALFDGNSTYHVPNKSPEDKVFNFSVEPIDYVDFIGIDTILSNYSNQNCDEIYMVENAFLSKIVRVFVSSLGILMASGKSKAQEKHDKST